MNKLEIIAFYLPQFYPFEENNRWWGDGFTEWTNVRNARPLFDGHNQPRKPDELGYYDLRDRGVRERQAELARQAGITAFCYWYYWMGDGHRLMTEVLDDIIESGVPDLPFCLGWANHSWYDKDWSDNGGDRLLAPQKYSGAEDCMAHFDYLFKAFSNPLYLKIDDCPVLYVFDPVSLPDYYVDHLIELSRQHGYPGLYLIANIADPKYRKDCFLKKGYKAVSYQRLGETVFPGASASHRMLRGIERVFRGLTSAMTGNTLNCRDYAACIKTLITKDDRADDVIPCLLPQWDHTPRSGRHGHFLTNATPEAFARHCRDAIMAVRHKDRPILFLKSWNEWGEGNMMEPDETFGRGFITALRKTLDQLS